MVLGWIVCSVVSLSLQSNGVGGSFQTEFFQINDATGVSQLSSFRVNLDRLDWDKDNVLQGHKNELKTLEVKNNKEMTYKLNKIENGSSDIKEQYLKELEKVKSFSCQLLLR